MVMGLAASAPLAAGQTASDAQAKAEVGGARLDLRVSPVIDLHFYVLWLAEGHAAPPAWIAPAVAAAKKLDAELGGSPLAWYVIEAELFNCESAKDVAAVFAKLPEEHTVRARRGGNTIPLRSLAVALSDAYQQVEPEFLKSTWPEHKGTIEKVVQLVQGRLIPKQKECFDYMLDSLGMKDPKTAIPVYITAVGPDPGAVTHRRGPYEGVCFVAASAAEGTQLLETVLHEATHALDVAEESEGALEQIRSGLQEAGFGPFDKDLRDVPHTLMFVQAAETIRRKIDPGHKDYGEVMGYYAKVPSAVAAVREPWTNFLDGKISRDSAIKQIVANAISTHRGPLRRTKP